MRYKKADDRSQVFMSSLEEMVDPDSFARVIDLFVGALPLEELGWLLNGLMPSPRTICYFRTNNVQAIKNADRHFVKLLKDWHLIDGTIIALDYTRIRGQNSLKNNYNERKINRHVEYLENKVDEYLDQIDKLGDSKVDWKKKEELSRKVDNAEDRVGFYEDLSKQVKESTDGQVSTIDPDAKSGILHRNIVNVGYIIHASVDSKHHFNVDTFAGGVNDRADLAVAAKRCQHLLQDDKIDLLADKGYHNGADIAFCEDCRVIPSSAWQRYGVPLNDDNHVQRLGGPLRTWIPPSRKHHQKDKGFRKSDFTYDPQTDTYICPDGQTLEVELTFKKKNNRRTYRVKRYATKMCDGCPLRSTCTTSLQGRKIERPNHQANVARNDARVKRYPEFYRLRQQIVEPIFGVWKRQWHFDHLMMKSKQKVESEISLAALTYNLLRLISLKGKNWLQKELKLPILIDIIHQNHHATLELKTSPFKKSTTSAFVDHCHMLQAA